MHGISALVKELEILSSVVVVVTAVCKFGNLLYVYIYARSFLPMSPDWKYCYKYLVTAILHFTNPIYAKSFLLLVAPDCCCACTN